ncbi:MAG: L-threonine 3-dehydrogenase [Chloroflexi bacterium]|nr:MAG: L-threonine 3-dehydrogenase [Chloroflexota bacterium]
MSAVVKIAPGPGLSLATIDVPQIAPHEILVKVRAASICGTDLHIYRWDDWSQGRIKPPLVVGHEFCGTVVECGARVTGVAAGDFISAESHVTCGACPQCRTGRAHLCQHTQIIGVDRDGCFAEYVAIPAANAWLNPPDMDPEIACLQENFGNAVHTAFKTDLTAKKVLVTGCGPVGLMAIEVVRSAGPRAIYATDISPYRLDLARRLGADLALNPREVDVVDTIMRETEGEGVDVLLEMSGAPSAIVQGFTLLKDGGEAALLGLSPAPFEFDLNNHIIFKGVTVYGVIGRQIWETWYQMRGLLKANAVNLRPIVTHLFPLEDFEHAFQAMASGESGKVVLFPDKAEYEAALARMSSG